MDFSPRLDSWSADDVGRRRRTLRPGLPRTSRRADEPDERRPVTFRRAFVATVTVLVLLCSVLVVAANGRGPSLSSAQVGRAAVTTTPDQQLRLFVTESVAHIRASQVTVTPRARFTVQTAGTVITLQFTDRLRSATRYGVEISGVTSVFGSRSTSITKVFTTAPATVLVLERNPAGQDRIVRASVDVPGRSVIYRASRIQAFGAIGSDLVVVTDDGATSTMSLVSAGGVKEDLLLPGPGLVRAFALNAPAGIVTFSWCPQTSPSARPRVFTIDLQGQHTSVRPAGAAARTATSALATPPTTETSRGRAELTPDGGAVRLTPRAGSRPITLVRALAAQRFSRLSASPNGQYVSVVSSAADSASDAYTITPTASAPTTLIIDVATGATVSTFAGASLAW